MIRSSRVFPIAAAILTVASVASSEVMVGSAGEAWNGSEGNCFRRDWGRVRNAYCSGTRLYTLAVSPHFGTRTIRGTGGTGVTCAAIVTDKTGWNIWWTGQINLAPVDGVTLGTVDISYGNGLLFECYLPEHYSNYLGTVEY